MAWGQIIAADCSDGKREHPVATSIPPVNCAAAA